MNPNTIQIESKMNHTGAVESAIKALETLPEQVRTIATETAINDLKRTLESIQGAPINFETKERILVINTETGASEVISQDFEPSCFYKFKVLEETEELQEEPAKFKVMLQVSHIPDHWITSRQLFSKYWN